MRYIDISLPIQSQMMVYKNKPEKQPKIRAINHLSEGGSYESELTLNVHTGTHIDFPLHMQNNGQTSTGFDPTRLIRDVFVIDCGDTTIINERFLSRYPLTKGMFILLKTRSSYHQEFLFDFPYVDQSGAAYCVAKELEGVGIDSLGIERDQPAHETHHAFMNANIIILEGLRLKDIKEGTYHMIALPLSIPHLDALPIRALLRVSE